MIVGFTGTRQGMNQQQYRIFASLMKPLFGVITAFHHGGCVGADGQAHLAMLGHSAIVVWPGPVESLKASCCQPRHDVTIMDPRPFLERNDEIVAVCDLLVVAPQIGTNEKSVGGTWYTFRQAKARKRPTLIIWP